MPEKSRLLVRPNRQFVIVSSICIYWFLSLFPARIGADYSALLQMIREGKSTDWWTGSYYWFLRFTSVDGRLPELTAAIQLAIFASSIIWFIYSLPGIKKVKELTTYLFLCLPIFGFFGMTISHDLTQTSGIILLCGIELRLLRKVEIKRLSLLYTVALALVLTTHSGLLVSVAVLLRTATMKSFRMTTLIVITIISCAFVANLGLTKGLNVYGNFINTSWVKYWPSVNVLKCIAQHPEAEINPQEWETLMGIAPKSAWKEPVSCSDYDVTVVAVGHANIVKNNDVLTSRDYLKTYLSVFAKNPAIGVMAHIQRSRGALPPLLFQPPENQVSLDVKVPIGIGTNTALQAGPELLHPSIDIPGEEDRKPEFFNVLEYPAQGLAFIMNQASWFWGWGGLWLLLSFIMLSKRLSEFRILRVFSCMYPAFLVHLAYVYFIPASLPRYYMFSICMGVILCVHFLFSMKKN